MSIRSKKIVLLYEPLEGVDFFDVLYDSNASVIVSYPGFQHRFVAIYSMILDKLRPRSICRHVDLFKLFI